MYSWSITPVGSLSCCTRLNRSSGVSTTVEPGLARQCSRKVPRNTRRHETGELVAMLRNEHGRLVVCRKQDRFASDSASRVHEASYEIGPILAPCCRPDEAACQMARSSGG